jgi:transposase
LSVFFFEGIDGVLVAYEAGSQMYWVNEVIREMGMESYPFHAKNFVAIVRSKKKTDKKDAQKIAMQAVKENLPSQVVISTEDERELKEFLMEREARKKDLLALGNELHAIAISTGYRIKKRTKLGNSVKKWEEEIEKLEGRAKERAKRLFRQALVLLQLIEEIEEKIKSQASRGEYGEVRQRLTKQPGMGFWSATALIAWSGVDAAKFPTVRQGAAYFGMVTETRESGDKKRLGKITKDGPPLVRKLMVQSAWAFIRSREGRASQWGQWFLQEVKRRPNQKKILIIALARKLLSAAIACLNGT